jgi:copper transport protein
LPRGAEAIVVTSILLGLAAATASTGLQGLDALALPAAAIGNATVWMTGIGTSYGVTVVLLVVSFLAALWPAHASEQFTARLRVVAALICGGLALLASGHAATADPQWLARPAVFVHVVSVAFWIGALVPLAAMLRAGGKPATEALAAFSRGIPYVLVPLVLAGLGLALLQFDDVSGLWTTDYGIVFMLKMAGVAVLLGIAALNRFVLTPGISAGVGTASRQLRRAIGAEVIVVAVIFVLVASWRFTPPPRALAAENMSPVLVHIHTEKAMSDVSIAPGRAGRVTATIMLQTGDFQALDAKGVTLEFSNASAGIEPFARPAKKLEDGRWSVDDLTIPAGGRWKVSTEILIDDFDKVILDGEIDLRP